MKTTLIALFSAVATLTATAQERTTQATLYQQFKPSVIYLTDGRKLTQNLTNVFLKNSSLVYMKGSFAMEANMGNIARVEFDDRQYEVVEKQLAQVVDSIGGNVVYRVDYLDMDAYQAQLKNNINISNLSLGEQISTTTVDMNNEEDYKFPLVHKYYMRYGGELFPVHEREIWRRLPKDKDVRRMFKTIISKRDFSWTSDASVSELLKAIVSVQTTEEK
ncbi:MAG: hypothetical protein II949_04650 [Prevotella sp.]|nr:hypothetical protein [Prevotella sp.]